MHINERDQVNYHGFLRALREMQGVSQETAAKGVCTVSGMNRFENGNRNAEKLMRDRLTSRLGISGEKYEDYLQPKEYVRWEQRLRIVNAIEKRDLELAKSELEAYASLENLNRINLQFIEAMRFNIRYLEKASGEELFDCIKVAVKRTVPNMKKALAGAHLLADQEINLIAEQMRWSPSPSVVANEADWRIQEYQKLITYMENSQWEKLLKAKVYPKVTYYICQCLLEKEATIQELRRGLELCHTAIELLRDTSRLYYFIELTECRRALATQVLNMDISSSEKEELETMLKENNEWEQVFKGLYEEYQVPVYMSDFCYLYYENESHNIVEIIETRRNMLGISRVKLSEGICSDRSIIRFEREGYNPCIEMVRCLFERLGMCAEYRRTRFVSSNSEVLRLATVITKNINDRNYIEWNTNLNNLKSLLNMDISYNRQQVKRYEALLEYRKKNIGIQGYFNQMMSALECTIEKEALYRKKEVYLTRSEMTCLYDFAFKMKGDFSEQCYKILNELYMAMMKTEKRKLFMPSLELLAGGLASKWGDEGEHDASIQISERMLKECLFNRRMEDLSNNIYNIQWNYQELVKIDRLKYDKKMINQLLDKCIILSHVIKKHDWEAFLQDKKLKLYD